MDGPLRVGGQTLIGSRPARVLLGTADGSSAGQLVATAESLGQAVPEMLALGRCLEGMVAQGDTRESCQHPPCRISRRS
jgi:hypothetical protein